MVCPRRTVNTLTDGREDSHTPTVGRKDCQYTHARRENSCIFMAKRKKVTHTAERTVMHTHT